MQQPLLPIVTEADRKATEYINNNCIALACRMGCDYCCHLRVDIFPHEATVIVEYILTTLALDDIVTLRSRLEAHVNAVDGLTIQQHHTTNMTCPLLVQSECSVYPVRPIQCRAYTSLDVRSCEYSFKNPHDTRERRNTDQGLESLWDRERSRVLNVSGQKPLELGGRVLAELNRATRGTTG
jgi:Fe-S-cluster containining protein